MAAEIAKRDSDRVPVMLGVSNDANLEPRMLRINPATNALVVDAGTITTTNAANGSTGAAVPATATYIGGNLGGNLTGLKFGQQTMANSLAVVLPSDQVGAAIVLGDGVATTTTLPVVSYGVLFNGGTTWDRMRGGQGDGAGSTGLQDIVGRLYNGATYDRMRSAPGVTGAAAIGGLTASGVAIAAAPVTIGKRAATALPTAVADGQVVNDFGDKFGRDVVLLGTLRDLTGTQGTTISASTAETTIVTAGGAGVFNDLVMLIISNTSASTNTRIDIRDTTAGTILFSIQSVGGAAPVGFALPIPIPQTGANTNWTAQCATSTTDIRIYAVFAKNK